MKFIDSAGDAWRPAGGDDHGDAPLIFTLAQWQQARATRPVTLRSGLAVPNTADLAALDEDLDRVALLALEFPKMSDGRAYTQARLLRGRYGYRGEIRATGEVIADMLPLLQRCGFDAVQLRADQDLATAQRALQFFTGFYQGDTLQPTPRFARAA
jgi:uncharacterized protein (DUF934 family)